MSPSHENTCYCTVLITMRTLFQLSSQTRTDGDKNSLQTCYFNFYTCTLAWPPKPKFFNMLGTQLDRQCELYTWIVKQGIH